MSRQASLLPEARLRLDQIPPEGRVISVSSDEEARRQITERLGITGLDALSASLKGVRFRGGIRVTGAIEASAIQPCVVTFDPVIQHLSEPVDRIFLPASQRPREVEPGAETFVDLEGEDPPDYFEGHEIDLTELIIETVSLGLDPYPRAPGADLPVLEQDHDESPFAALSKLRTDDAGR